MAKIKKPSLDFNLKPKEAIAYLENKGYKTTFHYDEIMHEAHHKAFTIAKVARLDLLHDIHGSIAKAMENGQRFEEWKQELMPTLEKKGWWGREEIVDPKTGEVKEVIIDGRRVRNIFKTNVRTARATARCKQQRQGTMNVYWRYIGGLSEHARDAHLAKHGTVLHRDDPWWQYNYPPNGWGCQCRVRSYSKVKLEKRGYKVAKSGGESIASKDWDYNICAGSKMASLSKMDLDSSLSVLHKSSKNRTYENLSQAELLSVFYKKMNVKRGEVFIDKVGDPMVIDDALFTSHTGHLKIDKRDRHLLLDEMIPTIKDPDEIYLEFDVKASRLVKKMFRYITIDSKKRAMIAIFEYKKDKTQGVSLHLLDSATGIEKRREEKLVYKRASD